ncbi:hypothetical protein [Tunturiibacter lichenicola]|uniref:hypothetical protein n=1 Tax=Tunturiibacter lichenicola TaxID=2051959 RepID=UPI003D9B6D78
MNKTASNAVYVVVAVMLIFAASAQAAPVQSASTLLACTAAQLSLSFDGKGGNLSGLSQSGALLVLRNIGSRTYSCRAPLVFEDALNTRLPVFRKASTGMHPHPVIIFVPIPGAEASSKMYQRSGDVSDISKYVSTASFRIALGTDIVPASFSDHHRVASGQDAKYRFAYLKRDPVYVRSKI